MRARFFKDRTIKQAGKLSTTRTIGNENNKSRMEGK